MRVSEARAREPLEERGDHRRHAAALRRPPQFPGVLECLHVSGLPGQPRTQFVNACDTQLDAASFVAERQRVLQLPEAAVTKEAGGAVVVGGCRVGRYGAEQTPLWKAADDGQVETARRLLAGRDGRRGVEVDRATASNGTTPLSQAAFQNFPEVVEVLLEYRADANKGNHNGFTPLMVAAKKGSKQVAMLLLARAPT